MSIGLVLTILFVLLKAFDKVGWSWWLVFLPLIIELVLDGIILIGVVVGGTKATKTIRRRR